VKKIFIAIGKFIASLFTDGEWDGDLVKVAGVALIVVGVIGWFNKLDPTFIIGFGAALAATGKFSKQG
jgi:hypothetical protein